MAKENMFSQASKKRKEEQQNIVESVKNSTSNEVIEEKKEEVKSSKGTNTSDNGAKTRTIEVKRQDGSVSTREIKVTEKRKTLPVYIPETMYAQFDAINTAYGKSNNSAIVELIRDYVTEKKGVLNEV